MLRRKVGRIFLVVVVFMTIVAISFSAEFGKGKYQPFLEQLFFGTLQSGGPAYNSWVKGLKEEKNLDVIRIVSKVTVKEEEEKEGRAFVLFELTIKSYCKNSLGFMVTVICRRVIGTVIKIDEMKIEAGKSMFLEEEIEIVNGWNNAKDI